MQANWTTYKLGDIVDDIAMGPFGSNIKVDNFVSSGVPVIRGTNLNEGGFNIEGQFAFITEEKASSLKRSLAYPDDLVFTHRGTLGQVGIIPRDKYPKYLVSQSQMKLTVNRVFLVPKFLYYFFKTQKGQYELLKNRSQVGVPAIATPTKALKQIVIDLPSIAEQNIIASILSSLDDKIELNIKMNQTLESIAQAIFKQWFIDFQFPGSTGEMENGIPKGWVKIRLGSICDKITKGTTPTTLKKNYTTEGINFIKVESISDHGELLPEKFAFIDEETDKLLNRSRIFENDILYTIAGTIGRIAIVDRSILPANINQAVAIIRVNSQILNPVVLKYFLKSYNSQSTITSKIVQGVQANISLTVLSSSEIILPSKEMLKKAEIIFTSLENKIVANINQIRLLKNIRDSLLPKLITGQIRVAGA